MHHYVVGVKTICIIDKCEKLIKLIYYQLIMKII